jgi:hypothetical protein
MEHNDITFDLIENQIAKITPDKILLHDNQYINKKYISGVKSYHSQDPTYKIINDHSIYTITYRYDNKLYKNKIPFDGYNPDLMSNYAYLHDMIIGYIN